MPRDAEGRPQCRGLNLYVKVQITALFWRKQLERDAPDSGCENQGVTKYGHQSTKLLVARLHVSITVPRLAQPCCAENRQ